MTIVVLQSKLGTCKTELQQKKIKNEDCILISIVTWTRQQFNTTAIKHQKCIITGKHQGIHENTDMKSIQKTISLQKQRNKDQL